MNNEAEQLHKSAIAALNRGDLRNLHQCCQALLKLQPEHADGWFLLGIVASSQGQLAQAVNLFDRALGFAPQQPDYLAQKAKCLCMLKRDKEALSAAHAAIALNPEKALILDTLGVVMTNLGQYQEARELLAQAVARQPQRLQFQFNLATAEQFLGNIDAARHHYQQALSLNPEFTRAHWALSELEKERLTGERIPELERLIGKPGLNPEDQLYLAHALSREYEQQGNHVRAFDILVDAKQRRRAQIQYNPAEDSAIFEALKKAFSSSQIRTDADSKQGEDCIFIVGMPRTGTTLVERILSSHSEVSSLGELQNFGMAVRQSVESKSRVLLNDEIVEKALQVSASAIGSAYLTSLQDRRSDAGHFIDKMPLNFLYTGFIARCLPASKIICLHRNPMDTCLSNFRQLFAMNFSYYNYHYDLEDTARYIVAFEQLMAFWEQLLPGRVFHLHYEKLTRTPEPVVRDLLNHCQLPWQSACLEFHKNREAVATPSASQVREKLYTRAVGRWQKYQQQLAPAAAIFRQAGLNYDG